MPANDFAKLRSEGRTLDTTITDCPSSDFEYTDFKTSANIDGEYCATDDSCTHSGSSLSEGKLDGCTITCGWHGAEFDCKTGKLVKFPAKIRDLTSYNIVEESDNVFVEM